MREKLIDQRIDTLDWGGLTAGQAVGEAAQIFPRLDLKETVDKMNDLEQVEVVRQNALLGKTAPAAAEAPATEPGRRPRACRRWLPASRSTISPRWTCASQSCWPPRKCRCRQAAEADD